ncbi:MAG: tRNA lysidine(34) synthetase TilS [Bryobacteraceae bacterium]|nr:tRNA lysidine(34) synthetase TilS [Bryobacteraceae bacterium]
MSCVLQRIRNFIDQHSMVRGGTVLGVAVSGGADSLFLLNVLTRLAGELKVRLHILHLNHGLRGHESDFDAEFVQESGRVLGWPTTIDSVSLDPDGGNLEQRAREARLDFFARSQRMHALDRVATAHTRSDQAETVLYRLLRGSGTAGLSGIRPITSSGLVRPLLQIARPEVEEWLRANNLNWREDRTNLDLRFDRNRIRHHLIPILRADYSPSVTEILAATAEVARDEEDFWSAEIDRLLPEVVTKKKLSSTTLNAEKLSSLGLAPARRLIRRVIGEVKGNMRSIDLIHVERIRELALQADGHGRLQVPGLDVFRSFEWLQVGTPREVSRASLDYSYPVTVAAKASFHLPGPELAIFLERRQVGLSPANAIYNEVADDVASESLVGPLELRNWHPGDAIDLPERGMKKIKELFQEFRIPIWDRHLWPVLTCSERVVWSRFFGVAARNTVAEQTESVLRVLVRDLSSAQAVMNLRAEGHA